MGQLEGLIQKVNSAPSIREAVAIAQDRWANNYYLVTGKKDGKQRFESELLNYLDIIQDKPDLAKVQDKFSHFAAVMKAAVTGLSFRSEGHLYPIVYGNKIKVQIGGHGKKEMLMQMKEIKLVHEGQVVYKGDVFKHDKLNNKILEHTTTDKSVNTNKLEDIIAAYTRIEWHNGTIADVVVYQDELKKAKAASKNQGANSVWETWTSQMCAKVTYHRAKKLYHRYPEGIELNVGKDEEDNEEETTDTSYTSVPEQIPPPIDEPEIVPTRISKPKEEPTAFGD